MAPKKPCAVMMCPSGRYADIMAKKMMGLKQTSLFKVPDRSDLHRKWSSLLHTALYRDDVVCEHHFREEDVIRTVTRRVGGKMLNIPSARVRLAKDAVPMDLHSRRGSASSEDKTICALRSLLGSKDDEVIMSENSIIPVVNSCQAGQSNVDVREGGIVVNRSSTPPLPDTNVTRGEFFSGLEATVSNIAEYKGLQVEIPLIEPCSLETASKDDTEGVTDIIETIKDYCSTNPLPPSWSWYQENNMILFTQVNTKKREIRCFVECHSDLHAKVLTTDNREIDELSIRVSTIADLINLFEKIEAVMVCEGSEAAQRRSDECCGIVKSGKNVGKCVQHTSCMACRKLKKAPLKKKAMKLPTKKQIKERQDKWLEKFLTQQLSFMRD